MSNTNNYQGGKAFGVLMKQREKDLNEINQQFLSSGTYDKVEDLEEKLTTYKAQFIRFDTDGSGDIDFMELKYMLEKLEQPKTHLEIKKMIETVDSTDKGTINYPDFLIMMLGGKNSVLRMILIFEEKRKEKPKPAGIRKKQSLADLGIRPDMAQNLE
ncbi:allograft inflammatory factor 1-like [Bolinopsis microptera]|uniref:allograft inflammatory factor 1-like n=1 Tax=Bolinopsis microptera TaxID=2820187 RepID=UPI003079A47B